MSAQATFKADLTDDQVCSLAASIEQNAKAEMPTIRAALVLLARSSDQFNLIDSEDADPFVDLLTRISEAMARRKEEMGLLDTALARLFVLLQPFEEDAE